MKTDATGTIAVTLAWRAHELGFDDIGFCRVEPFNEWHDKAYEAVRRRLAYDPKALMADAECIVVAVRRYAVYGEWPEGSAPMPNYYVNSTVGFEEIKKLAEVLTECGYSATPNPLLPAKQASVRAGLGKQGMNTQFCHKEFGILVSLHMILTNANLCGEDCAHIECHGCGSCAAACPSGAIYAGGFDHEKCLRFHLAAGTTVPLWARDLMGNRLLGCTDCQHACPEANPKEVDVPADLAWACGIAGLLEGDDARYEKLAEYIGDNFAKKKRIRAQAAICAGNSGNRGYIPLLVALLTENSTVLRCHAAWALGKLGGPEAKNALENVLPDEKDDDVKKEIADAIRRMKN